MCTKYRKEMVWWQSLTINDLDNKSPPDTPAKKVSLKIKESGFGVFFF